MRKVLMISIVLGLLSGCITATKRDFEGVSTVGNVTFELTSKANDESGGSRGMCRVTETETKARDMTLATFRQLPGAYRVVLERQPNAQIACYERNFGDNFAKDATIVGGMGSDIYHPYAFYVVTVYKNQRLIYQKQVRETTTSTKHALNFSRIEELAAEGAAIFERTYAKVLTEASNAAQRSAGLAHPSGKELAAR